MKKIKNILFKTVLVTTFLFGTQTCLNLDEDTSSILQIDNLTDKDAINTALTSIYRQYTEIIRIPHEHFMTTYDADDVTT